VGCSGDAAVGTPKVRTAPIQTSVEAIQSEPTLAVWQMIEMDASFNSSQDGSCVRLQKLQDHAVALDADDPVPDGSVRQLENQNVSLDSAGMMLPVEVEPDFVVGNGKIGRIVSRIRPPDSLHLLEAEWRSSKTG
jgi:hypothetical protein